MAGDETDTGTDQPRRIPAPKKRAGVPPPAPRRKIPAPSAGTGAGSKSGAPSSEDEVIRLKAANDDAGTADISEVDDATRGNASEEALKELAAAWSVEEPSNAEKEAKPAIAGRKDRTEERESLVSWLAPLAETVAVPTGAGEPEPGPEADLPEVPDVAGQPIDEEEGAGAAEGQPPVGRDQEALHKDEQQPGDVQEDMPVGAVEAAEDPAGSAEADLLDNGVEEHREAETPDEDEPMIEAADQPGPEDTDEGEQEEEEPSLDGEDAPEGIGGDAPEKEDGRADGPEEVVASGGEDDEAGTLDAVGELSETAEDPAVSGEEAQPAEAEDDRPEEVGDSRDTVEDEPDGIGVEAAEVEPEGTGQETGEYQSPEPVGAEDEVPAATQAGLCGPAAPGAEAAKPDEEDKTEPPCAPDAIEEEASSQGPDDTEDPSGPEIESDADPEEPEVVAVAGLVAASAQAVDAEGPAKAPPPGWECPFEKVLLIGTGNMGAPMAANLFARAPNLWLFDRDTQSAETAAGRAGCHVASSLAEGVEGADCIILMLPNGDIVRRVIIDAMGDSPKLVSNLTRGAVVIDMSSSYPMTTLETGALLADRGVIMCDAPVSGGVRRAGDATLSIMLGGRDEDALALVQPMLESMGTVYRTGGLGSGHAMKVLNNYLSAIGLTAASEAVLIGRKFGLEPGVMVDIINNSTGRNNATDVKFHQHILNDKFGSGFHLDLMAKDLLGAARLAEELEMNATGLQREAELWQDASSAFERGSDHTEIFRFIEAQIDSEGT